MNKNKFNHFNLQLVPIQILHVVYESNGIAQRKQPQQHSVSQISNVNVSLNVAKHTNSS